MAQHTHLGRYLPVTPSERPLLLASSARDPADLVVLERAVEDVSSDLPRADRLLCEATRLACFELRGLLRLREAFLVRSGATTALLLAHDYASGALLSSLLAAARRRAEPVPTPVAAAIAVEILAILEKLHAPRGAGPSLHLRITPANVLVGPGGVSLRGLAWGLPSWPSAWLSPEQRDAFRYATPEQARGEPPSARSDLFQVGALLWEMLAGRPRIEASDLLGMLGKIRFQAPTSLRPTRSDVPDALDRLILQALDRRPSERLATARAFREELERCGGWGAWSGVEGWASGLGADPFPGPEVYHLRAAVADEEPPSSDVPAGYRG